MRKYTQWRIRKLFLCPSSYCKAFDQTGTEMIKSIPKRLKVFTILSRGLAWFGWD